MNNVLSQEDKQGGRLYPIWLLQGFQEVLDDCELMDVPLVGYPFTWELGHGTANWIEIRLDRALISPSFVNQFKDVKLINLEISTSDHAPILLEPYNTISITHIKRFKFENA